MGRWSIIKIVLIAFLMLVATSECARSNQSCSNCGAITARTAVDRTCKLDSIVRSDLLTPSIISRQAKELCDVYGASESSRSYPCNFTPTCNLGIRFKPASPSDFSSDRRIKLDAVVCNRDWSPQSARPTFTLVRRPTSTAGLRYIPSLASDERVRALLVGNVTRRFAFGYQFDPRKIRWGKTGRINIIANWLAITEKQSRPGLIIGTGAGRLENPLTQTVHLTLNKQLTRVGRLSVAGQVGLSGAKLHPGIMPTGGINIGFNGIGSSQLIFDGVHAHAIWTVRYRHQTFSIMMLRFHRVGAAYGITF
jgi:hypothetical protein